MRLHVDILGPEDFLGTLSRQVLDYINEFAATVITLAGIAFSVLIGEDAGRGLENGFGGEILARDELQLRVLALRLVTNGIVDFGINFGQGLRHPIGHEGEGHSNTEPR